MTDTSKHKNKRTRAERSLDLVEISQLHLSGHNPRQISEWLNANRDYDLHVNQIRYDIKSIEDQWRQSSLINFNAAINRELARLDVIEQEYWDAWRESRKPKKETKQEAVQENRTRRTGLKDPAYERKKAETKETTRDGNPEFLMGVRWCVEQRAKLLGLYQPEKLDINWRSEAKKYGVDTESLANQYFERLVNEYAANAESGSATGLLEAGDREAGLESGQEED